MARTLQWRNMLRNILRNTASSTIKNWCKCAGINSERTKTLIAYAEGVSAEEASRLMGYDVRTFSSMRLRALKQLRSFLASEPELCSAFTKYLSEKLPFDYGPVPENNH